MGQPLHTTPSEFNAAIVKRSKEELLSEHGDYYLVAHCLNKDIGRCIALLPSIKKLQCQLKKAGVGCSAVSQGFSITVCALHCVTV